MAKKDKKEKPKKNTGISQNSSLGRVAQQILSLVDSNYEASSDLEMKNSKFQKIINREMHIANGVSDGSIIDFIQAQRESGADPNKGNSPGNLQTSKNLFTDNIDQIYNYLVELYDNKYMEMVDLKMICKFIPVLGQAVKITLDHITASDEVADTIKRNIVFDTDVDDEDQEAIKDMVETGYWTMFVAEERGFVRGFITGTNYLGRAKIDNLYVDKRFHRQGIGTALVKAYQEYVDANGAEVLTVQTRPTLQAIDFYTKNGFERLKSSYLMQKML